MEADARLGDDVIHRYLERIGLDGGDHSLTALQRAHVTSVPYENLDIPLGREIRLDHESLVAKLIDGRRGGYCYEQNTLYGAVLEALGHPVTRCLARVRLGDAVSPRPATHMVLLVDGRLIDVGFGSANPLGPVPLGGEATYGPWTWSTERVRTPEGERAWTVRLFDSPLYTFTEDPKHAVDYVTPNHFSATHPRSIFTQFAMVQRWDRSDALVGLVDLTLTERRCGRSDQTSLIPVGDLGAVLRDRFALDLAADDLSRLTARLVT